MTYEWNDDKTGSQHSEGIQYSFIAQNIQEVFPTLIKKDNLGYLQTAYATYDAMMVEAFRALKKENDILRATSKAQSAELMEIKKQPTEMNELKNRMASLEAMLLSTGQR